MKKTILVTICLLIGTFVTLAEEKKGNIQVKGHVQIEGTKEDIPYVTITVHDEQANVITRQASDASGKFTLQLPQSGKYQLIISAVGYTTTTKDVDINDGEKSKDIGIVGMPEGVELKEVSVTALKPLIKSDPDKLVYSVESDPEAQSNTLEEMLRKVPLLSVDSEGEVTLNGQSNYKVLVNGKSSSLMSNNFKDVIKSMPASSIKDIEVITNPSSKYEAEGAGGIINIITARNTTNGYTGSVGLNANSRGGYGANAYIAATINKFSFSTNIYHNQYRQPKTNNRSEFINYDNDGQASQYLYTTGKTKYKYGGNSLNFEAGYEIDSLNLISASGWGFLGNNKIHDLTTNETMNQSKTPIRQFINDIHGKYQFGFLSGNIDYQRSFLKKDKTLTTSYKIEYNPFNRKTDSDIEGILDYESSQRKADNESSGQTHTFQLDYFDPLTEKHQVETGVKGIYRRNVSETDRFLYNPNNNSWGPDIYPPSDLDYNQYIIGAYAGYLFKYKKTSTKLGGRMEYTLNDGLHKGKENTEFDNTSFNVIPYINFTYALQPAQTIKASYTQRIYRPGIWELNPYIDNMSPHSQSYGNPDLEAEVSHAFSLSYGQFSPKFNFNIELNSSFADNSIQRYSFMENGVHYTTFDNIGTNQRHSANIYSSYRPSGKFSINVNARVNYVILEAKVRDGLTIHNEGAIYGGNLNMRLETWKGGAVTANAGGGSRWIMLLGKGNAYHYSSLGITQKLLKDKLDVGVYISDPFTRKISFENENYKDPTYSSYSKNERWGQTCRLSVTYRFGKMNTQVKKARRGINNDDQRSGEGQGGGGAQGGGQ